MMYELEWSQNDLILHKKNKITKTNLLFQEQTSLTFECKCMLCPKQLRLFQNDKKNILTI